MDQIELQNIGRRFNKHWIFKHLNYTFHQGLSYAILGANGSGKSTLLQVISGSLHPSEGKIYYSTLNKPILVEKVYQHIEYVAPYIELIEDFTFEEAISFHFKLKPLLSDYQISDIFECLQLPTSKSTVIKYFSSGMKQRLKLALAFFSASKVLLLDEPTSNLDHQGEQWYLSLFEKLRGSKTIIVSSNQEIEYQLCTHKLHIQDYKVKK